MKRPNLEDFIKANMTKQAKKNQHRTNFFRHHFNSLVLCQIIFDACLAMVCMKYTGSNFIVNAGILGLAMEVIMDFLKNVFLGYNKTDRPLINGMKIDKQLKTKMIESACSVIYNFCMIILLIDFIILLFTSIQITVPTALLMIVGAVMQGGAKRFLYRTVDEHKNYLPVFIFFDVLGTITLFIAFI